MRKADSFTLLEELIEMRESELRIKGQSLQKHVFLISQSFRPANLIKSAITEVASSQDLKWNLVKTAVGVGSGFIVRKLVTWKSRNPFTQIMGLALEVIVANIVKIDTGKIRDSILNRISEAGPGPK